MARQTVLLSLRARLILIVLAMTLALPAIAMLWTDDAKRSRWENRPLASWPSLAGAVRPGSDFPDRIDAWLEDHIGFALPLNRLYRQLLFHGFGDSPSPQVTLGRDGHVFLNSHEASTPFAAFRYLCGAVAEATYARAASDWLAVLDRFAQAHGNVVLGVAPSQAAIYPDKLPGSVSAELRRACASYAARAPAGRLVDDAARRGLRVVYPLDQFIAQRHEGNFYPRENFHFAGQSAHRFAEHLLLAVGIQPPPAWQEQRLVRKAADMQAIFGFKRQFWAPGYAYAAFGARLTEREPAFIRDCYPRASDFGTFETAAPITQRTALVLSDSFGAYAAPHLAPAYRQLTWINVSDLEPGQGGVFFGVCLPRLAADDLFLVFHDAAVLDRGTMLLARLIESPPVAP